MPNVIIEAAALYTLFIKRVSKVKLSDRTRNLFANLASYSFGIYLVHALILDLMGMAGIHSSSFTPIVMLPVTICLGFVISYIVVAVLRKIPVLGKKIT